MAQRRLPNSTPAVMRVLTTARDTYKNTAAPADRAIGVDIWNKLTDAVEDSFVNRFLKEVSDIDIALAAQTPLTSDLAQKAARLTMFVSHFHQVLDLGIIRGAFKPGARGYYGRDVHATALPDLSTYDAVEEAAQHIVDGEAARVAQEDSPVVLMSLPTAAEVGTLLAAFKGTRAQSKQAQSKTDREREDVTALYPEAQALAVDICDTVEFFYRKDPDPASRRAKAARWGVVYLYDNGGTTEPPPAGSPTPPPPAA